MHGVVSLLDDKYYVEVEQLWAELAEKFGVRGIYAVPYPHFSYQVVEDYDLERLELILTKVARFNRPFRVITTGLGIFTGLRPVLYIPVVRNSELTEFHQRIWDEISQAAINPRDYYHPSRWMPHITVADLDLNHQTLGQIASMLSKRSFMWELTIDNLALIYDTGRGVELRMRFEL